MDEVVARWKRLALKNTNMFSVGISVPPDGMSRAGEEDPVWTGWTRSASPVRTGWRRVPGMEPDGEYPATEPDD